MGKLDKEQKKKFFLNSFVYGPISLVGGLLLAYALGTFMGLEASFGSIAFMILVCGSAYLLGVIRFYRRLSKSKGNNNDSYFS